jgi:hypothetical protein
MQQWISEIYTVSICYFSFCELCFNGKLIWKCFEMFIQVTVFSFYLIKELENFYMVFKLRCSSLHFKFLVQLHRVIIYETFSLDTEKCSSFNQKIYWTRKSLNLKSKLALYISQLPILNQLFHFCEWKLLQSPLYETFWKCMFLRIEIFLSFRPNKQSYF